MSGKELTTEGYMKSLPLGTRLRVINGNWYCKICGSRGDKKIYLEFNGETHVINERVNDLDVEVVG